METIRLAQVEDADGIARVHVESWRTTYKGMVPDVYLAQLSHERYEQLWKEALSDARSREGIFVATNEQGKVVGFVSGGPEREKDAVYKGELYAIYLLKEMQGHGTGRALLKALVEKLVQTELYTMLVWVLSDNPACRFYEAMGGKQLKEKWEETGGVLLKEHAYGWLDIRSLVEQG